MSRDVGARCHEASPKTGYLMWSVLVRIATGRLLSVWNHHCFWRSSPDSSLQSDWYLTVKSKVSNPLWVLCFFSIPVDTVQVLYSAVHFERRSDNGNEFCFCCCYCKKDYFNSNYPSFMTLSLKRGAVREKVVKTTNLSKNVLRRLLQNTASAQRSTLYVWLW